MNCHSNHTHSFNHDNHCLFTPFVHEERSNHIQHENRRRSELSLDPVASVRRRSELTFDPVSPDPYQSEAWYGY